MMSCSSAARICRERKKDLASKVKGIAAEKNELAKVAADLEARLKESESRLEKSKLWTAREREASKELEEELLMYKKEVVEYDEKDFNKAV